jgi:threonine dehydrogenase-like Zn-dependent dehydrogenase
VAPPEAAVAIPALLGGPPAAVIDCTGHPSGGPLAIELLAAAGRLTVVGMPDQPVPLDSRTLARLELIVRGSVVYSEDDFAEALNLVAGGRIPADQIVSTIAPLDAAPALVRELASNGTEELKVVLRCR